MQQAESFFKTKEGAYHLKKSVREIMESLEFQNKDFGEPCHISTVSLLTCTDILKRVFLISFQTGKGEKDAKSALTKRKQEALRQAKNEYVTQLYVKNIEEVSAKYKILRDELDESLERDKTTGELRSQNGLRVGASCGPSPSNYFFGYLAHISVYAYCLSPGAG